MQNAQSKALNLLIQLQIMGNISLPSSLPELAKYCDCLESVERFKYKPDPSQKSQKAQTVRNQETPKKQQPRRLVQQNVAQMLLQEPPTLKLNKTSSSQAAMKRRSNLRIKQNQNQNSKQKIEEISDISNEPQFNNTTNDLEIIQIDKDEDVKANDLRKFYNPLFRTAHDFKPQRTNPLIQTNLRDEHDEFDNIQISEINQVPSHDYQHQFFLNQDDKNEFIKKSHQIS